MKLFMILLGCNVDGRHTEQHDVFFGIGSSLADLRTAIEKFWPGQSLHIDVWREVSYVDGYAISVVERTHAEPQKTQSLYFINLGGYRANEFDELHYKMLIVAGDQREAVKNAKQSLFFKKTGFKGAAAHIDDQYGVDVDEAYNVEDILPAAMKLKYAIAITKSANVAEDHVHPGYLPLSKLKL